MTDFTLSPAFTIDGIGAASGIALSDGFIWLVSDKSAQLYRFGTQSGITEKFPLLAGTGAEFLPKKLKPDFESLCLHEGKLFAFGSGSTNARNRMAVFDPETFHPETFDLSGLFAQMQEISGIPAVDFNIEGACFADGWRFLHRGNAPSGRNGMFLVEGNLLEKPQLAFIEIGLPRIGNVRTTFTDACFDGRDIWFLAAAEDSVSVYEDGAVTGSMIGRMDLGGNVLMTQLISSTQKFEGLAIAGSTEEEMKFMLCEDDDSDKLSTTLYRLSIKKNR